MSGPRVNRTVASPTTPPIPAPIPAPLAPSAMAPIPAPGMVVVAMVAASFPLARLLDGALTVLYGALLESRHAFERTRQHDRVAVRENHRGEGHLQLGPSLHLSRMHDAANSALNERAFGNTILLFWTMGKTVCA